MDVLQHQHKADLIADWLYGIYHDLYTFEEFLQSDVLAFWINQL